MDTQNTTGSQGSAVGIIVVIIVLVIGAFYFFSELKTPIDTTGTDTLPPTSTSTDTGAIEDDLNAEDFSSIDKEMTDLEAEFR